MTVTPAAAASPVMIEVGGVPTAVIDTGAADQNLPLLLLHGSGPGVTATANWRLVVPGFAARRRVIAPDQLGFGGTATGEDRQFGRQAWTRHAVGLLDQLGIDQVDVVGNSMGGSIALSLAASQPDRVRRLVLMGTMGVDMALPPGLDAVWGYAPSLDAMERTIRLFTDDERLITGDLVRLRYEASIQPAVRDSWAAMFPPPRQRWVDDLALDRQQLAQLTHPVLLVHGRDDHVVPLRSSSLPLLDLLPRAELHVFGGCGHWTMIERTQPFIALVQEFLDRPDR